jgi:RNA polymerase sigma-70 factor (ECF subfamily)
MGTPDGFESLVLQYRGRLSVWIALRLGELLRTRVTEEDVFQETLLEAYRSFAGARLDGPEAFRRWIFSIAENRIKDLHKYHAAQRRHPAREAMTGPERALLDRLSADLPSPSSLARRNELAGVLAEGIRRLPEAERRVVEMRALEGLTFREIAARTRRPKAAVATAYGRALVALRRELGG